MQISINQLKPYTKHWRDGKHVFPDWFGHFTFYHGVERPGFVTESS